MSKTKTIVAAGEILVEFVSHRLDCGLETVAEYSGPYPSGAPAIFLDQAARMGARTRMFGGVGADGFGRAILKRLKADGVGIDDVHVSPDRSTGTAFVSYHASGDRDFIFHITGTAADRFEMSPATLDPADTILHVSAASLGNPTMRATIMAAVDAVMDGGGWMSCDPNARPELMRDEDARAALFDVMARSHCLMPSTSDLAFLYPELSEDVAVERLLSANADVVALKRGADGATIMGPDGRFDVPGHQVTEIDPTGAGDCFCGTFMALMAQGVPLADAGRLANAAGAIAVTRRGPMEGNSSPAEIDAFLDRAGQRTP